MVCASQECMVHSTNVAWKGWDTLMKKLLFTHKVGALQTHIDTLKLNIEKLYPIENAEFLPTQVAGNLAIKTGDWSEYHRTCMTFDGIVVTSLKIGKSNARLVNEMRVKGKEVLFWNGQELCPVEGVKVIDQYDWKTGWMMIYKKTK